MREFFADLVQRMPAWLDASGPEAGIVLSTRARLARNLRAFPFPHHASAVELATVRGELGRRLGECPDLAAAQLLELGELEDRELRLLVECGLVGADLVSQPQSRALYAVSEDRFVLVNEEDHLQLIALRSGFAPNSALDAAMDLDRRVEDLIDPAFDEEWGYLTASPAGVGTGLRLSVLLHLPGLVLAGEIEKICNALGQLQFKVQGLYQKGRSVRGAIFQVSNLVCLGQSETEMARDFRFHLGRLIQHERNARDQLLARDPVGVEDMVHRNLAILRSARLITSQEAIDRLSHVRLGVDLGVVAAPGLDCLNEVYRRSRKAHLEALADRKLDSKALSQARADYLRGLVQGI